MYKLFHAGVLVVFGLGGYWVYKVYLKDSNVPTTGTDDYWAGLNLGITGWVPQLPIHPRSMAPTNATYTHVKVTSKRGRPNDIVTARTMDYYNPSQLVPSIGPLNLAPMPGVNTKFVSPPSGKADFTENDPGSLTGGGPLPTIVGSGVAYQDRVSLRSA